MIDKIPNEKLIQLFRQCDELSKVYSELKQLRQKKEDNKEMISFFKDNKFANDKHLLITVGGQFIKSSKAEAFSFTERTQTQVIKDIKDKEAKQEKLIKSIRTIDPKLELLPEDAFFIVSEYILQEEEDEDYEDI